MIQVTPKLNKNEHYANILNKLFNLPSLQKGVSDTLLLH